MYMIKYLFGVLAVGHGWIAHSHYIQNGITYGLVGLGLGLLCMYVAIKHS